VPVNVPRFSEVGWHDFIAEFLLGRFTGYRLVGGGYPLAKPGLPQDPVPTHSTTPARSRLREDGQPTPTLDVGCDGRHPRRGRLPGMRGLQRCAFPGKPEPMREHARNAGLPGACPVNSPGDTSRGFPRGTWRRSLAARSSGAARARRWTGRNSAPRFRQARLSASSRQRSASAPSVAGIATHNGRFHDDLPQPRVAVTHLARGHIRGTPPLTTPADWQR
jgi:hypothetical protein